MPPKNSEEKIKEMLKEKHGDTVEIDFSTYRATRFLALFIDKDYGEWWATPNNVIHHGKGHKKRGIVKYLKNLRLTYGEQYDNVFQVPEIKEKTKQTNIEKTGYDNQFKDPKVREKWRETMEDRYGVAHPSHLSSFKQSVSEKNKTNSEERFRKTRATNLRKYNNVNPMMNADIALKSAKKSNNAGVILHWKTKEELVWVASYEKAVIEWLNKNRTEFSWQSKVFKTPFFTKKNSIITYRPDLYLLNEDKWIEIKGYLRKDALLKWEWFHKEYPNSELWDRKKLKEMSIL